MRVLILSDMEGISGIVTWEQVNNGEPMYEEARKLYTEEVNAAVRGVKAAGADEIVAVDFHGAGGSRTFNSYVPELIDPNCTWVGHHDWLRYDDLMKVGFDAAMIVGAHSRAGTPDGVLCHTVSSTSWRNLWFNGEIVGETAINAAYVGHYGVPVVMVAGDAAVSREAKALLGDGLTTVVVKQGFTKFSARQVPPVRARQMIEDAACKALQNVGAVKPYVPARPTTVEIQYTGIEMLQPYRGKANVRIVEDEIKIITQAADWLQAWKQARNW